MKTNLLFLLSLCTIGCTSNEDATDCKCGTIVNKVYVPPFASAPDFTILKVQNDCTGKITTISLDGNQGELNGKWCNE